MALIAVVTVSVLTTSLLLVTRQISRSQAQVVDRNRAFYLAEAGLAEAFAGLAIGKTGNVGTWDEPAAFGDGLFVVEAGEDLNGWVTLESTGMVAGGKAVLSLVVEPGETSVAHLGVFSAEGLELQAGSVLDGYDSSLGPYDPDAPLEARVGANGPITLAGSSRAPTTVVASVRAGPDQRVGLGANVAFRGSRGSLRRPEELPPVVAPGLPLAPGITHRSPVPLVVPPGEGGVEFIDVESGSGLVLMGPATLVVERLHVASESTLELDTSGGPIDLYVLEDLEVERGAVVSCTNDDPSLVTIQVAARRPGRARSGGKAPEPAVRLGAGGALHGFLYAPEADVVVDGPLEVFGGLVGRRLVLGSGARLHTDRHLATLAETSALPHLVSWRILDLESAAGVAAVNPFLALGVDRDDLRAPAESHHDQHLELDYLDDSGAIQHYEGSEAAFDWSLVDTPLSGKRDGESFSAPRNLDEPAPDEEVEHEQGGPEGSPCQDTSLADLHVGGQTPDGAALKAELDASTPANLAHRIQYSDRRIVARQRIHNSAGRSVLYAMDRGMACRRYTPVAQSYLMVLEGSATVRRGGHTRTLGAGDTLPLRRWRPHDIRALTRVKCVVVTLY